MLDLSIFESSTPDKASRAERRAIREAKLNAIVKAGFTHAGTLQKQASSIVAGKPLSFLNVTVDATKPSSAACAVCSGVHGSDGKRITRADLLAKTHVLLSADQKAAILVSDTCYNGDDKGNSGLAGRVKPTQVSK